MRRVRLSLLVVLPALLVACGSDPTDAEDTAVDGGGSSSTSTGDAASSTTDAAGSEGTTSATGADTAADTSGTTEAAVDSSSGSGDGGDGVEDYCFCLLVRCHDVFHDRFGDPDKVALAACGEEASALAPGSPDDMTGDSLACRRFHCAAAEADPMACSAALGDEICLER